MNTFFKKSILKLKPKIKYMFHSHIYLWKKVKQTVTDIVIQQHSGNIVGDLFSPYIILEEFSR